MNYRSFGSRSWALLLGAITFAVTAAEPHGTSKLAPVPIQQVQIEDEFWSPKFAVWREVTIPDCFAKFEKDGALTNFDKIRDGIGGEHGGPPWYDGLIYEMIRGSADFLATKRDPVVEAQLDGYIERIAAAAAKDPNGYLNTYTQLKEPTHRWGQNGGDDNHQHDVYNASALIEAGVHYYRATGKTQLLQVAVKLANHMADLMGPPPRQNIVPGHSLGEEALVNLYRLFREQPELKSRLSAPVNEEQYLKLAEFWIENRGHHEGRKNFGSYGQDHQPVLEQQTIEGHAVRATLLCAGLVATAQVNGREDYLTAAQRLWTNMVERRMYVIGGLGAVAGHEGFGPDYELPNNGYLETCAAIGAAFFHRNLNLATGDARYADELERVLYNGILSGVSLKGDTYFYENPLEATKKRTRWSWHGCPCCPPMFLKVMGALPGYIYAQNEDGIFVNLFIGSRASLTLNGKKVELRQTTRYPWDGNVQITMESDPRAKFALNLRLPAWCDTPQIKVNGRVQKQVEKLNGYARIEREWRKGDRVELSLPMPVQRVHAHPKVEADIGRVALQRGPIVYCVEGVDNGGQVRNLVLPPGGELSAEHRKDFLAGVTVIRGLAQGLYQADWPRAPYLPATQTPGVSDVNLLAIPYYANANRQPADLMVWLAETPLKAEPSPQSIKPTKTTLGEQRSVITVNADQILHRVTPYLTGACIEDVNHEVYGGIDSQMIFGESFAEPAAQLPLKGFKTFGGRWTVDDDGTLQALGSSGVKAIWDGLAFTDGEVSVDLRLTEAGGGNGGLILKVNDAGNGSDQFTGYEVSLERPGFLVLGRHRQNWEPLRRVPCDVPVNEWINLTVRLGTNSLEVLVNGKSITRFEDVGHPLAAGSVGLRTWQHEVRFRNLVIASSVPGETPQRIPFKYDTGSRPMDSVSGMWRAIRQGEVAGSFTLESKDAFFGRQSQQVSFASGSGVLGIENQSLNRWGMNFVKDKSYDGYVYVRAATPTEFFVSLESKDGAQVYSQKRLKAIGDKWQRVNFSLKPNAADTAGRFAIKLKQPGTLSVGYVFLQPGEWGRFQGLPVRKDVALGLIDQGITVLRLGGCMANAAEYRWKKMIGPRELRPPYEGWWYPHSSNGWGVFEFLNFSEAAGFLGIPDVNCNETPQDVADFIEYVNGDPNSKWGSRRAADGHPKPYGLKYLQIGNEECVDESYWLKFKGIAEAVWAKDPQIILVVGDFAYGQKIEDPFDFRGAAGGITTLAAQQKILQLAKAHNREVWFDVHVTTEGPQPDFGGTFSYMDALNKLADGAKHRVVIFEYNAGNHSQRRALANAAATIQVQRDGRVPVVTSANCLQPDGQNDNGWDQGLLFLNPSKVWLQPPGYVTRMIARNYQPLVVRSEVLPTVSPINVCATRSEDGKVLVLQVVNSSDQEVTLPLKIAGFVPRKKTAQVQTLAALLDEHNTAEQPYRVKPVVAEWQHGIKDGQTTVTIPAHAFTVIRF